MAVDKTNVTTLHVEEKPYTTLINDVVQGLQNPDALAIWVYLQSKSSGWRVIASHIQAHFGIGRHRYRAAMRCLHGEGLITYTSHRNAAGQLEGKEIIVHWRPKLEHQPNVQETERSVLPTVGKTTPYEIQESFTKGEKGTKCSSGDERMDEAFDTFWIAGMRKQGKQLAKRKFKAAAKRSGGDPMGFAMMLANDIGIRKAAGQLGFDKMLPATYLEQQRWEDERPEECPHGQIAAIWNETMPSHIPKVSIEDWRPGAKGYDDLQKAWQHLKTVPRKVSGKPVFETTERGLDFYRMVWGKLAASPRLQEESSSRWCKFTWAVKVDTTVAIAKDEYS